MSTFLITRLVVKSSFNFLSESRKRVQIRNFQMAALPTVPTKRISPSGLTLEAKLRESTTIIESELGYKEEDRDDSFRLIRTISVSNQEIIKLIRRGELSRATSMVEDSKSIFVQLISSIGSSVSKREEKLSSHLERFGTAVMLLDFFSTGKLSSPTSFPLCNDEEYIAASIGWSQELSRYALQRAIDGDVQSVEIVRCALTELHQLLLTFDFRNGTLRRRYDAMKYYVKSVEDITYELSLLPQGVGMGVFHDALPTVTASDATQEDGHKAQAHPSALWQYVDGDAISAIQHRMATYDHQREWTIKLSRDVQKLSKQAIFSIIRGQNEDAREKLAHASKTIEQVMDIVTKFPGLRAGSFSNSLEEWCEAQMLLDWCEKKTVSGVNELVHKLSAQEYIGGLSDFTGELGRLAVMLAAKREIEAVEEIMEVDSIIYDSISRVNNLGSNFNKKLDAVQTNWKKVEDLVFELNILERTGRGKKRMRMTEDVPDSSMEKSEH